MTIERQIMAGVMRADMAIMDYILPAIAFVFGLVVIGMVRRVMRIWQRRKANSRQS